MTTTRFDDDEPDLDALYADLAAADLQPLWRQAGLLPPAPNRLGPHRWDGRTLRALAERAGALVGIDRGGDRRVLALSHPDLGGLPFATHTLWAAVQYLKGHESAPAHRHSPAALRFVLEGSGVWTLVDGDPIAMEPGDLVLTPGNTWHEHRSRGDEPMIWFDGLDLPLVRALDAVFFEPGPDDLTPFSPGDPCRSEERFGRVGLRPAGEAAPGRHSALLVYRWDATDAALRAQLASTGRDHARVRYTDPATGADVMPTLRAELQRVLAGGRTTATRTVGSAVCVVHRGAGSSLVGGHRVDWTAGDVFVVPSWAWAQHRADADADLFVLSDTPVIEALGLGRRAERSETEENTPMPGISRVGGTS
ncbi:cupin domain-containing protein [Actinomadura rayongensis]|uniref:Cupin domain-containing protein n=1 Tax=Actinomadura rayongensis TaxID=1429076 RepID=A0A6I4WLB2_9ACTN|nr:cupin domain-containing protein [Actinomadura rayongensis]MXQ67412.1 cupin domain-containing protein [Actinomadura rayongensis]